MLTKYLGSSILAFSALAIACSPSIAQERRISHLMIPDSLSDSPPAVLKIASSCRSKCRQKVKSCKRRCPRVAQWAESAGPTAVMPTRTAKSVASAFACCIKDKSPTLTGLILKNCRQQDISA